MYLTHVSSVFLYNSCTWTLTVSQEQHIDYFQRRLIRTNVLNVRWPKIVKNDKVYELSKIRPWSIKIREQRMTWLGHVFRMDSDIPAKKALHFAQQQYQRPRGRPKLTWINLVTEQLLNNMGITWEEASKTANDRKSWRTLVQNKYY